jgi:ABC-2 type transport system permease protein
MRAILSIAAKDIALLVRDRPGLFFSAAFPLIYAIFFGSIFSGMSSKPASGIKVAIVDLDQSEGSKTFAKDINESSSFDAQTFATRDEGIDAVRKGRRTAVVVIEPGFGRGMASPFGGEPPALTIGADPARAAESGMVEGLLTERLFSRFQAMFTDPDRAQEMVRSSLEQVQSDQTIAPLTKGVLTTFLGQLDQFATALPEAIDQESAGDEGTEEGAGFQPFKLTKLDVLRQNDGPGRRPNSFEISFPQGIAWGIMGVAAGFGLSLVVERTRGTMLRLRVAPISPAAVLMGKALGCFVAIVGVMSLLIAVGVAVPAFSVRPASWPLLGAAIVCSAIGFVGIMMISSVLGRTEASASGITWAVLTIMAMLGGGMVPLMFMPSWMQAASNVSPVKWAITALEGAIWRGYTPAEMALPCGVLLGVGVVGFAIGSTVFMRRAEG